MSVWFIERETDPNGKEAPGSGAWTIYAGAFYCYNRAIRYKHNLCPKSYRIARYERAEII